MSYGHRCGRARRPRKTGLYKEVARVFEKIFVPGKKLSLKEIKSALNALAMNTEWEMEWGYEDWRINHLLLRWSERKGVIIHKESIVHRLLGGAMGYEKGRDDYFYLENEKLEK